jgi:membrane fusion protein, multidrug efflux system
VVGIAVIAAVSLGAVWWINHRSVTPAAGPGGGGGGFGGGGRFGGGRGGATPISTAAAEKGQLKVYLSALGSVTALNTTTVKAQATGELMAIHFSEGQLVKEGDVLAEIDPRQYRISLEQAQGQLARDAALLENVRRDLERYVNAKEAVTQQQSDTAQATVAQYEGTVRADQASVDNYKLQLSYCSVTAPITGRVGLRMVDQGNMVRTSDPGIVVITQEQPISVVFSIPEDSLPQVRKAIADGRELGVDVYDRGMKVRLASGKLFALDNQIDSTTGTVRLKALFTNEDQGLFPNQFVNVRMLTDVLDDVTLIPNSAIQLNGAARFVFVVKGDETVERRTITVGRTEGEKTVVADGLALGETVVTEGLDRLQSGSKVISRTPIAEAPAPSGRGGKGGRGGRGGRGPRPDDKGMPAQKSP